MERLKGGLLITPQDIQNLFGWHIVTCRDEHRRVRDALGKDKNNKKLTIGEYCKAEDLDLDEITLRLNQFPR